MINVIAARFNKILNTSNRISITHPNITNADRRISGETTTSKGTCGMSHFMPDSSRTAMKAIPNAILNIRQSV